MRLVTWLGLVLRRVWSKRLILLGSFLGAMFVTALLAIVPLYEASVQSVDLRFTLRGAPAPEVDLVASAQLQEYSGTDAEANRSLVEELNDGVSAWYPTSLERLQSREVVVIPTDGSIDWIARGEAWQEEYDQAVADEVPEEERPAPPYPTPPQEATQVRMFTSPVLDGKLNVIDGEFPSAQTPAPTDYAEPLRIAIGSDVATSIARGVGDRFIVKPFASLPDVFELVEVAAIVEAADGNDPIWGGDPAESLFFLGLDDWDTLTAPWSVDPASDPWRRARRGLTGLTVIQVVTLQFDAPTVELEDIPDLAREVSSFRTSLSRDSSGEVRATSSIGTLLDSFATRSVTIGAPILAVLALVVGGALYFLVYTAALTLEREGPELALLRTRGASVWQTVGLHVAQAALVAVLAALAAPPVARALVGLTGRVPPLSDLTGGEPLPVAQIRSIVPFIVVGALVTFVAMGLAVVPFARRGVLELRSLAARPSVSSVWQRWNLDIFAIALSLLLLFQLSQRGFLNFTEDEVRLDPLAVVFPVLLLFTGALLLLRALPVVLRIIGWFMTRSRSMSVALPGWHLGRNPVPYGRLALLVWLTTGLGAFALTYANTLDQSFADRAAFETGADLRIVDTDGGFLDVPEGATGTPVLRTIGSPRQATRPAEVLAIRPAEFASIVNWRDDFGPDPAKVFASLRVDGAPPDLGVVLPPDASSLVVDGVIVPSAAERGGVRLTIKALDARGRMWTIEADDDLVETEWRTLRFDLESGLNNVFDSPPEPPLTIHTIWAERSDPLSSARIGGESIVIASVVVQSSTGEATAVLLDGLEAINGLTRTSADATIVAEAFLAAQDDVTSDPASTPLYRTGTVDVWNMPTARSRISSDIPALRTVPGPLRVLLAPEVAAASGLAVGDESTFGLESLILEGTLVGLIPQIPTMSDGRREGRMIVDLDVVTALQHGDPRWGVGTQPPGFARPQELWLQSTDPEGTLRRILASYGVGQQPDAVFSVAATTADFSSRPVQVGLVAILFVGAAVSIVLALAGVTGYVLLAVARRTREMGVLRAIGLKRNEVARTFAIEQVVVVGLGAIVGVAGGIALMWAMLPFLQLGETAEVVEPTIRLAPPWPTLAVYVALVGGLLILSVLWSTGKVSIRRMSEVLREVER